VFFADRPMVQTACKGTRTPEAVSSQAFILPV